MSIILKFLFFALINPIRSVCMYSISCFSTQTTTALTGFVFIIIRYAQAKLPAQPGCEIFPLPFQECWCSIPLDILWGSASGSCDCACCNAWQGSSHDTCVVLWTPNDVFTDFGSSISTLGGTLHFCNMQHYFQKTIHLEDLHTIHGNNTLDRCILKNFHYL